jgi:hypothetical protein
MELYRITRGEQFPIKVSKTNFSHSGCDNERTRILALRAPATICEKGFQVYKFLVLVFESVAVHDLDEGPGFPCLPELVKRARRG